ncbi:hypothetical protein EJB05_00961 [Eragrostis curvula]|uniref:Uncharacterized protein n=1 Tax=Eragrostis curvula TaxID=38414 RepID=A0A5J9WNF7_9POAL|nr:hypothetical protein EJB05_00961 [Eragrostis curvula]
MVFSSLPIFLDPPNWGQASSPRCWLTAPAPTRRRALRRAAARLPRAPPAAAAAALEASLEGYHHHGYLPLQMPTPHQFLHHQGGLLHGGYHFADGDGGLFADGFPRGVASGLLAQLAAVKMEEHNNNNSGGGNGGAAAHEQSSYWPGNGGGGNGWPAEFLSGFSSSSSGNALECEKQQVNY